MDVGIERCSRLKVCLHEERRTERQRREKDLRKVERGDEWRGSRKGWMET